MKTVNRCCNADSIVLDSRPNGTGRRRRRKCPKCKTRWTTYEVRDVDPTLARAKITQATQQLRMASHHLATVTKHLAEVLEAVEYGEEEDDD